MMTTFKFLFILYFCTKNGILGQYTANILQDMAQANLRSTTAKPSVGMSP